MCHVVRPDSSYKDMHSLLYYKKIICYESRYFGGRLNRCCLWKNLYYALRGWRYSNISVAGVEGTATGVEGTATGVGARTM